MPLFRRGAAIAALILLACGLAPAARAAGGESRATAPGFPVASEVRIAGDARQTRLIFDLDRKVDLRAFMLADPYRVVIDLPQVTFQLPAKAGEQGRGLVKVFRYGLVMAGGSRIVIDLTGPAKIEQAAVLESVNGQPARLVIELAATDRAAFLQSMAVPSRPTRAEAPAAVPPASGDPRPVVVIDPGHGGLDTGTIAPSGENEKALVLDFAQALNAALVKTGKYRVVMTRHDDTFIPLADRVNIARKEKAALFVSIHADALPKSEGDAQGATVYTLSDRASDAEAARLAESENRADVIAGVDLSEEPSEVADILIDLAQRETRAFSGRFAHLVVQEMKRVARLHPKPLKSAGFRVLKAPDVPSVLVELGYVSNKENLHDLLSSAWRGRAVGSIAQAIDGFFANKQAAAGAAK